MTALTVKLPSSLERRLRQFAKRDETSVSQFVASAIAEKMSALEAAEYLQKRKKISRKKFEHALSFIPDVPPMPGDEIR